MNLRALRMFVTAAESGGLLSASEQLHLSQPAASRQLQGLEADLGVQLFHRGGRNLQLTAEGVDLLRQSRQLLKAADMLADRARALKGGATGTLRVAATPQVIAGVLAPFLRAYQRRHPGVEVQLMEGGAAQQPDRLERGEVHLAIMPSGDARFSGRLLYPVYALAAMAKGHALSKHVTVDIAELADEPLLLLRREFGSRVWFDRACELARIKPRVRLESAAPHTLVELAAAGYGVAVIPSTVIGHNEAVKFLPIVSKGQSLGRWSMVAWDRDRLLPQYAQHFVDELVAHSQRANPDKTITRRAPPLPMPQLTAQLAR
jgi:LysR family transcriptional regulator, cyn operon transcriptional activator